MSSKATIDINAGREDIAKFIKENKVPIKVTEVVDGKKKKRGVKALREDLDRLGYAVTGKKKPKGKAPTTLKGLRKAQERKKEETGIQIQGFSSETKPPAPQVSGQEVELMGAISGNLSAEQEVIYKNLPPAEEMRQYLNTKMTSNQFRNISLRQLKLLYMKTKADDNEQEFAPQYKDLPPLPEIKSYLREQLPSVNIDTLTLVGIKELYIKTKPKVDEAIRLKAEQEEERQEQQAQEQQAQEIETDDEEIDYDNMSEQSLEGQRDDDLDLNENFLRWGYITQEEYEENKSRTLYLYEEAKKRQMTPEEKAAWLARQREYEDESETEPEPEGLTDEDFEGELIDFEGVSYQYLPDNEDDLYNMKGDFVGQWNVDVDDINFINDKFRQQHEDIRMGRKQPARRQIKRREMEPEPASEAGGFTEEEIETLIDLAGDTSRYLPVRRDAWRQLRDAGIYIQEPKKEEVDTDDDLEVTNDDREEIRFEDVRYFIDEDDIISRPYDREGDWAGGRGEIKDGAAIFNIRGERVGTWSTDDEDIIFSSAEFSLLHQDQGYENDSDL